MAFQTVIRYSTDAGLQGASSVHEDGKPNEICLQGLQCDTQYYVMADLVEDGVRVAQSELKSFTTLKCGAMTLTYDYYRRTSCAAHTVVYNYTSNYAASSCILHVAGPNGFTANYQGVIDSNAGTVTFTASDWEGGEGYTFNATLYNIYGDQFTSGTTSVTSGTIDEIELSVTAVTETTVTLAISKCNDCGFYVGWVDVWLGTEDPDTDPSDFHETITSSDTGITITGLTSDTAYYFRGTFVCDDEQTEITGAAVSATTAHDYSADYMTIENVGTTNVNVTWRKLGSSDRPASLYASEDGTNWTSYSARDPMENLPSFTLNKGKKRMLKVSKSSGRNGFVDFASDGQVIVYGNALSMIYGDNFVNHSNIPVQGLKWMFLGHTDSPNTQIISAEHLVFGKPGDSVIIDEEGCYGMFAGCPNLRYAPVMSNVIRVGQNGLNRLFAGCQALEKGVDLSGVASVGTTGCEQLYYNCSSLTDATAPNISTWSTADFTNWLYGVLFTGTVHKPAALSIPANDVSGVPSGWTTQNY